MNQTTPTATTTTNDIPTQHDDWTQSRKLPPPPHQVDAALDLSHTQNIGAMLRTHFSNSQFIVVSLKEVRPATSSTRRGPLPNSRLRRRHLVPFPWQLPS